MTPNDKREKIEQSLILPMVQKAGANGPKDPQEEMKKMREARLGQAQAKARQVNVRKKLAEVQKNAALTIVAEHRVGSGETLSHIAEQYYGSSARDKWMAIYEVNKEEIGDNPSSLRVGLVLKIPKL